MYFAYDEKIKSKKNKSILIQKDTIPNILKLPGQEEFVKGILREESEQSLDTRISRYRELPAIMVKMKDEKDEYVKILHEARRLYEEGKFYSCVAMCGVTSGRIAKDILKRIIIVKKVNKATPSKFFNQLDGIPMDVVRELIIAAGSVDSSLRNAFKQLASLRYKYVHARQISSQEDAQKAIKYLHEIIEGTVSVFKEYKIQKGKLVRR